nr:sugar ABC transporter ATP-binding protein [uncultured Oscillibacter sp.]
MSEAVVSTHNITKSFGGIKAIQDINLEFYSGEIHALMGENGAGKSTLCKILSGAYTPDSGSVEINGKKFSSLTPQLAKSLGVGMIYQEFNLVNELTVYENIFLGKEIKLGLINDNRRMIEQTEKLFERLSIKIDPLAKVKNLSVAYCQLVEIAKTLQENSKIIVFDEPTAPLTESEIQVLFDIIRRLREEGLTIIYISHRMDEIEALTDRVTIMRDGTAIKTLNTKDTSRQEIIRLMIGRSLNETFPAKNTVVYDNTPVLEVRHLSNAKLSDINFKLYKGEILGIAGLVGAGRTEILRALFGADPILSGEILINGQPLDVKNNPRRAIESGISLVPEDRKRQGLHLMLSIQHNLTLAKIKDMSRLLVIDSKREKASLDSYINKLSIKHGGIKNPVSSLSGGNQQKVVVSKWLLTEGDIILFDEPTRGIDVGAKKEIYELLDQLRREGKAVIMVSSEMPEVIGMCNRVVVMYEGVQQTVLDQCDMTQERIMEYASGIIH